MKKIVVLLFALTAATSSFASWHAFNTTPYCLRDVMPPVYGSMQVYDLIADGGLSPSNPIITKAVWDTAAKKAAGKMPIWLQGGIPFRLGATSLVCPSKLQVKGDAAFLSLINVNTSTPTSATTPLFVSYGASDITFQDFTITCKKRVLAAFRINSYGTNDSTQCKNITFSHINFTDLYGDGIYMGDSDPNDLNATHNTDNLIVEYCNFLRIGNPAKLVTLDDNAPDSSTCNAIDLRATTCTGKIMYNTASFCTANFLRAYGWIQASVAAGRLRSPNRKLGNWDIMYNTVTDSYGGIATVGNGYINYPRIMYNRVINPTRNSGFAFSIEGYNIYTEGNVAETWEGRDAYELKGIDGNFGRDFALIHTCRNANPNTWRNYTISNRCNFIQVQGYDNTYHTICRYDTTGGISPYMPTRWCGIALVGKGDSPTYQDTSWEGVTDYAYGMHFDGLELYNFNADAIDAEVNTFRDVTVSSNCKFVTSFLKTNEYLMRGNGYGWLWDNPYVDVKGIPNRRTTPLFAVAQAWTNKFGTKLLNWIIKGPNKYENAN